MNILLLIHRLWNGGGTETHVLALATELRRMGHAVGVFTAGGAWLPLFRQYGIPIYTDPAYPDQATVLRRVVEKHGYQILHAHDAESFRLVRRLWGRGALPAVFTVHGRYVDPRTLNICATAANAVVAVSPAIRDYVASCGVPLHKIHYIENGVPTRVFHPGHGSTLRKRLHIPDDGFVVGYAGRFTGDKLNLSRRIGALLSRYSASHRHTYAIIAGRHSRAQQKPGNRCMVLGARSDMANFYRACDVVIGTGRVALEAMACGVPTIAGGYARYIGRVTPENIESMYRTNFGDHDAHRQSWHQTLVMRDLEAVRRDRPAVRRDARVLAGVVRERFSAERMARRLVRLYAEQLAPGRGRNPRRSGAV